MSPAAKGTGGLNGINDIIVALQMIQKIAHDFGGDKNRVTLYGSGSSSEVCSLIRHGEAHAHEPASRAEERA